MEKVVKKFSKILQRNFNKGGRGGGSKAVYKLYKKTGEMVKGAFPKQYDGWVCLIYGQIEIENTTYITCQTIPTYPDSCFSFMSDGGAELTSFC